MSNFTFSCSRGGRKLSFVRQPSKLKTINASEYLKWNLHFLRSFRLFRFGRFVLLFRVLVHAEIINDTSQSKYFDSISVCWQKWSCQEVLRSLEKRKGHKMQGVRVDFEGFFFFWMCQKWKSCLLTLKRSVWSAVTMVIKQNGFMSGEHRRHRPSYCSAVLLICSLTGFL